MKNILKLLTILSLTGFIGGCNSGSSSSSNTVSIVGPNVTNPFNADNICNFSDSMTSCTISLSYQADPAASLSVSGVSTPYSVASNSCTNTESAADCTVNITYTPQSAISSQTASFTIGGYTAPITVSLTNQQ